MYDVIYPKSDILKKHIVSFNILKIDHGRSVTYNAFPQQGATISYLKNAKIETNIDTLNFSSEKTNIQLLLLGKYLTPLKLSYKQPIVEVSINFNSVGINYFFENYFIQFAPENIQITNCETSKLFPSNMFQYSEDEMINRLEAFLIGIYKEIDLSNIKIATELLLENPELKTTEIAKKVNLTEKTLYRKFKKYVGCTTTEYKKICRFRNAIKDNFNNLSNKNLTELCLDNHFYDSPHFSREVKKITNLNPKEFFNKVSEVGIDSYPYIFF